MLREGTGWEPWRQWKSDVLPTLRASTREKARARAEPTGSTAALMTLSQKVARKCVVGTLSSTLSSRGDNCRAT